MTKTIPCPNSDCYKGAIEGGFDPVLEVNLTEICPICQGHSFVEVPTESPEHKKERHMNYGV